MNALFPSICIPQNQLWSQGRQKAKCNYTSAIVLVAWRQNIMRKSNICDDQFIQILIKKGKRIPIEKGKITLCGYFVALDLYGNFIAFL